MALTTQQCVDIFAILQDKYGSPDLVEDEVVSLLNFAQYEWLNRLIPSQLGGVVNYELDQNTLTNIKPLLFPITGTMNGSGILTNAAITAALVTAGAESGATWYRIANVGITISGDTYPVKFTKHNNLWQFQRNFFKKASATKLRFTIRQDGLKFYPTDAANTLSLTIIKNPKVWALSPAVDPEQDLQNTYSIVAIALKLAGVATRDGEILEDIRTTALQITQ